MYIGTILFTYTRSIHTGKVLKALSQNTVLPEKLFIFHDGLKENGDDKEWNAVQKAIEEVDWCEKEIIIFPDNKGLAKSVVDGINYVLKTCDAVIVLEDDCVPAPSFMQFMIQCLETYINDKKVYNISGYAWPIDVSNEEYDAYFTGRTCSWGWGTWKDRWAEYEQDFSIWDKITGDRQKSLDLSIWGNDLETYFRDRIQGKNDSWAIFWSLIVLYKQGLCVAPCKSLIDNIGFDGSGVHCDENDFYKTKLNLEKRESFKLPLIRSGMDDKVKKAFGVVSGVSSALYNNDNGKNVIIYGLGYSWQVHKRALAEKFNIIAFMDRNKKGYYEGKKVITKDELKQYKDSLIIITLKDIEMSNSIKEELSKYFMPDKIIYAVDLLKD